MSPLASAYSSTHPPTPGWTVPASLARTGPGRAPRPAPDEASLTTAAEHVPVATTTSNAEAVAGKVVIDVTNPLAPDPSGLATDEVAGAELVRQAAPQARVVKAFNTVLAGNQATAEVDGVQLDGFVGGDDAEAKQIVSDLPAEVGFPPIDVGPLSFARYLEAWR